MSREKLYKKVLEEINKVINEYKFGESNGYYMIKGLLKGLKISEDNNENNSEDASDKNTRSVFSSRDVLVEAIDKYNEENPDDNVYECVTENGTLLYQKTYLDE